MHVGAAGMGGIKIDKLKKKNCSSGASESRWSSRFATSMIRFTMVASLRTKRPECWGCGNVPRLSRAPSSGSSSVGNSSSTIRDSSKGLKVVDAARCFPAQESDERDEGST